MNTIGSFRRRAGQTGTSLLEILVVVAVLGIIAGIGTVVIGQAVEGSRATKAKSDVAHLNRAVEVYLTNGGSLAEISKADEVIAKLKTRLNAEQAATQVGLTGSVIDARLLPVHIEPSKRDKPGRRISWNSSLKKFELSEGTTGPGISHFILAAEAATAKEEAREKNSFSYAKEDSWIWDYEETSLPPPSPGPTTIAVISNPPDSLPPGSSPPYLPPSSPPTGGFAKLNPPEFSIPEGSYPLGNYFLNVSLNDPNPAGAGEIYYRIAGTTDWAPYPAGTSLTIYPEDKIDAFVVSNDPVVADSSSIAASKYSSSPVTLTLSLSVDEGSVSYYDLTENDIFARALVSNLGAVPSYLQAPNLYEILFAVSNADTPSSQNSLESTSVGAAAVVKLSPSLWQDDESIDLFAIAKSNGGQWILSSETEMLSVTAQSETLPTPEIEKIDVGDGKYEIAISHSDKVPSGTLIVYSDSGELPEIDPSTRLPVEGKPYDKPFTWEPGEGSSSEGDSDTATLVAVVFPPEDLGLWFEKSDPTAVSVELDSPSGSCIGFAAVKNSLNLNGTLDGSLRVLGSNSLVLNSGAKILGDLYMSGTPTVVNNGSASFKGTREEDGPSDPSGHTVMMNSGVELDFVVRKSEPFDFPEVSVSPSTTGPTITIDSPSDLPSSWFPNSGVNTNSNAGTVHLPPGNYGTVNASNSVGDGKIILGNTNGTLAEYHFKSLTFNSGVPVEILGPVIINTEYFAVNGGSQIGNESSQSNLTINITGSQFIDNSNSKVYAKQIVVPNGASHINGEVWASILTKDLTINGSGTLHAGSGKCE